jgi:hypothetical protein
MHQFVLHAARVAAAASRQDWPFVNLHLPDLGQTMPVALYVVFQHTRTAEPLHRERRVIQTVPPVVARSVVPPALTQRLETSILLIAQQPGDTADALRCARSHSVCYRLLAPHIHPSTPRGSRAAR